HEITAAAWVDFRVGDPSAAWSTIDDAFRLGHAGSPAMLAERAALGVAAGVRMVQSGGPDPGLDLMLERTAAGEPSVVGRAWQRTAVAERSAMDGDDPARWADATAAWEATGHFPHLVAYTRARQGAVVADVPTAFELLNAAHTAAVRLRATPLQQLVEQTAGARSITIGEPEHDPVAALTARERQVLELVSEGLDNRRIGKTLGIAEKTASVHVSNLLRKLGLSSRTEAAVFAIRNDAADGLHDR
ncbi:MAG: response regulator transcription factor, partial [Ilumatobacteraceae bacterium]